MQSGKREEVGEVDLQLPENLQKRVAVLASNTVAQARAYALLVRTIAEVLFGIPPTHTVKKAHKPVLGLFGLAQAYYCVHEVQCRNALHGHITLWVKNLDPKLIHRIVHVPELREKLICVIESVVSATTLDFEHVYSSQDHGKTNCGAESAKPSRRKSKVDACNRIRKQSRSTDPQGSIRTGTEMYVRKSTKGMEHLGWVRVVKVQRRRGGKNGVVLLRRILKPGGEYYPSTCHALRLCRKLKT